MEQFNKAVKELQEGNYKEAQKILEQILTKDPKNVKSLINLGVAYKNQGQILKAADFYQKAIQLDSKSFAAYNNLANIYISQKQFKKANESFLEAIKLKPDYADGYANLGVLFQEKGDMVKAKKYYRKAIFYNPKLIDAVSNLSRLMEAEGQFNKSYLFAKRASEINPEDASSLKYLGDISRKIGKLDEARLCYQKAIELDPRMAGAYSSLLEVLLSLCEWDTAEKVHKQIDEMGAETPFLALRLHKDLRNHREIAASWSGEVAANALQANVRFGFWLRRKNQKIRVGYLGAAALQLLPLHNRKKFEIFAYSYGGSNKGEVKKRLNKSVDRFIDIRNKSDKQAAKRINRDKVDILVDLMGHTPGGRMGILAHTPSPFRISYLGFGGTSGAKFINYIIADKILIPESEKKFYSEEVLYMSGSFVNFEKEKSDHKILSKKVFGLDQQSFVFCSFNEPYKISFELFNSWMRILKKVPKSALLLLSGGKTSEENLKKYARKAGIEEKRLIFIKNTPTDVLSCLSVCDLALDTWEYSGGASTFNALGLGVPVITLKGWSYLSRTSDSMLVNIGLPELIAKSPKEYEDLAVSLALNPKKLQATRHKLHANRLTYPLFDTQKFIKNLESHYSRIVRSK